MRRSRRSAFAARPSPAETLSPCPSEPVAASKKGKPAVEFARGGAEEFEIVDRDGPEVVGLAEHPAEVGEGGVDDGDGVPLAEHETVGSRIRGVLRIPAHGVVHEDRDEVPQAHRAARVPAAGRGRHVQREFVQVNGLGVDGGFK